MYIRLFIKSDNEAEAIKYSNEVLAVFTGLLENIKLNHIGVYGKDNTLYELEYTAYFDHDNLSIIEAWKETIYSIASVWEINYTNAICDFPTDFVMSKEIQNNHIYFERLSFMWILLNEM